MIYVKKQQIVPTKFVFATEGLINYTDLKDENRKIVTDLLLTEQGNLCPICERLSSRFTPTIEHFLPLSIFPHLQLDYYNLYVSCKACNEPKGNYLIPAYIFDARFRPFTNTLEKGLKPTYELIDAACEIVVPTARIASKLPSYYNSCILQNTLDLLNQNRYKEPTKYPEKNSLLHQRSAVWKAMQPIIGNLNDHELNRKYLQYRQNTVSYPEYPSLIAFLFEQTFKKRGLPLPEYQDREQPFILFLHKYPIRK